jgi:hypothetical protein
LNTWFDKQDIVWGDSICQKIESGLSRARFGLIIISKSYLQKYWTNNELDGFFQKESVGQKTILPIWHKITQKELVECKPILAGRSALNSSKCSCEQIADELIKILGK